MANGRISKFEERWALPALQGTPKQVGWARRIRRDILQPGLEAAERERQARLAEIPDEEAFCEEVDVMEVDAEALAPLLNERRAKWWIENRFASFEELRRGAQRAWLREFARGY